MYFKIVIVQENVRQVLVNIELNQLQNIITVPMVIRFVAE